MKNVGELLLYLIAAGMGMLTGLSIMVGSAILAAKVIGVIMVLLSVGMSIVVWCEHKED